VTGEIELTAADGEDQHIAQPRHHDSLIALPTRRAAKPNDDAVD
jgi:hypothetical protein